MAESKDFREEMQRIGQLVQEIELIADPAMKASTKNLVQSIMDLHGAAMERALEIVAAAGEQGLSIIHQMGSDPLVSSVLLLYGLHPDDFEARVANAVDQIPPEAAKAGL